MIAIDVSTFVAILLNVPWHHEQCHRGCHDQGYCLDHRRPAGHGPLVFGGAVRSTPFLCYVAVCCVFISCCCLCVVLFYAVFYVYLV